MRYENKYFREVLENDLKEHALGVNIHCREDGIHITVPPYPITGDDFTDDYGAETIKEEQNTEIVVSKIKDIISKYEIGVTSTNAIYGDNVKIKLNIYELSNN